MKRTRNTSTITVDRYAYRLSQELINVLNDLLLQLEGLEEREHPALKIGFLIERSLHEGAELAGERPSGEASMVEDEILRVG